MLPDGTSEHRDYDAAGRLVAKTDFAGRQTAYTYDAQGRLLTRKYPDNSQVVFTYDAAGQRKTVTDTRGTTQYTYDTRGHVSSLVYPDNTELDYTYDPRGARSSVTAKVGTSVLTTSTAFDDDGRVASVKDPLNRSYGVQYNAIGTPLIAQLPEYAGNNVRVRHSRQTHEPCHQGARSQRHHRPELRVHPRRRGQTHQHRRG